ncbi:hypothetical protein TRFO_36625 [Tritrichomonas foetus]|uniref:Uncharacterized protein n=1 Tax=Tritrichomonas foetus TaxID=1144522 RepID=A0A1J4JJ05_9EUKA|nr:hypothetical protein TRFO_36625 [Tritrichomonas foetus]|eukprot:OHS97204.1 hypothetical protein TRFO_36625 [Tritrichomonas foetus]
MKIQKVISLNMSLINYVFYILLVGPLWIQYYLSSNKLVSSYKAKITLLFKVLPSYNISGLLTRHTLWYHIWDDLKDKNDDELDYFLNKIFPTANNQKSKLFDCDNPHKYVHSKQENHEEILFPDSSYYKWISSNAKMELKNMTIFSDNFNVLPKTSEFQKKLFQHQNPMTCEGKRFIELPINDWGLGAVLIHLARKFIMSVNHGYIPIISRRKWIWTSGANFCTKDKTYTCFFQERSIRM